MLRILFCGGGSVGHLAPSLAVWESLKNKRPDVSALFVCARRADDRAFLREHRARHVPVHAPKLTNHWTTVFLPVLFPIACLEAFLTILLFRPHVIFAKGGYVSVPVCLMGWLMRRPIVLHESDRMMGRANRLLLRFARHLCIGTPQKELARGRAAACATVPVTATGNPIRPTILRGTADGGKRVTGFSGKRPVLLAIGGSQGSQAINAAVWERLPELLGLCDVIHLTGRRKLNREIRHARYFQHETSSDELHNLYAFADLVLSRAGAGTIAELAALGKATILVPLPENVQKHQRENAHFLDVANAVIVLDQKTLRDTIAPTVRALLADAERMRGLGERLRAFAEPNAADRIANILIETARPARRGAEKRCMMPPCPGSESSPSSSPSPSSAPAPEESRIVRRPEQTIPPAPRRLGARKRKPAAAASSRAGAPSS